MKIDLICNVCNDEIKGDAEMIGQKCKKCPDGSYVDKASEEAEGSKPEKSKGTEAGGETKITKENLIEMIELIQNENAYDFNKKFKIAFKENIKEAIINRRTEMLKEYSDSTETINEMEVGDMGTLDDGSEFSIIALDEDTITIRVGGKEMEMSMDEFTSRAKVNSSI